MSSQSTLTSIRLDDDTMQGLDMLVGQDGLNNRSDVIRLAIQQLLHGQAKLPGMKSVRVPIGRQMEQQLASLYELFGVTHEQAASEGLQLYIDKRVEQLGLQDILNDAVAEARATTQPSKEYHE
ncbi:MAG: ribbon-helix-helix domain-containing protein [Candidatus Thermoplasmatota archaeon]|nr:ribbon-helix-helix domain-containing protein [Candidatus Thermoplasmatota archaeon]